LTGEDVIRFCKTHLAGFKVPIEVRFAETPFPRTATEKLIKAEIKKTYFAK